VFDCVCLYIRNVKGRQADANRTNKATARHTHQTIKVKKHMRTTLTQAELFKLHLLEQIYRDISTAQTYLIDNFPSDDSILRDLEIMGNILDTNIFFNNLQIEKNRLEAIQHKEYQAIQAMEAKNKQPDIS
jgi:hypothetical protein